MGKPMGIRITMIPYVTFQDLVQIGILVVAIISLFQAKKK